MYTRTCLSVFTFLQCVQLKKPKRSASVTEAKPAKVKDRKPAQPVQKLEEFTDLSRHKTGFIIKKKVSIANMLSWTKVSVYSVSYCISCSISTSFAYVSA